MRYDLIFHFCNLPHEHEKRHVHVYRKGVMRTYLLRKRPEYLSELARLGGTPSLSPTGLTVAFRSQDGPR